MNDKWNLPRILLNNLDTSKLVGPDIASGGRYERINSLLTEFTSSFLGHEWLSDECLKDSLTPGDIAMFEQTFPHYVVAPDPMEFLAKTLNYDYVGNI